MSINAYARNLSRGGSESKTVQASPGDTVELITYLNTSGNSTLTDVRVSSFLPNGLNFNNTTTVNGASSSGNIVSGGGLYLGDLNPGNSVTIRYQAIVSDHLFLNFIGSFLSTKFTAFSTNTSGVFDYTSVNVPRDTTTVITNNDDPFSQISIQKLGKNITRGDNVEQSSLTASPGDTLEFILRVRSNSSVTASNVIVNDFLPSGFSYISRTTSVNGVIKSDSITNSNGLNLGSLFSFQEVVIKFNATVNQSINLPSGTTTFANVAQVRGNNSSTVTSSMPIAVTNSTGTVAGASIAKVAGVATGTTGSLMLSLFLSALVTFVYMGYTKTGIFRQREAWAVVKKFRSDKNRFNFVNR